MSDVTPHNLQWPHTKNALTTFYYFLKHRKKKFKKDNKELQDIFLQTPVFATEKLDGTNVGKDDAGQIYGRRLLIADDKTDYQQTSLEPVRTINISRVKTVFCEIAKIDQDEIQKFIVYGELICNKLYDYAERKILGKWKVFGAILVTKNSKEIVKQLSIECFAVKMTGEKNQNILVLPNTTFFKILQSCGLETVDIKGDQKSIFDIVTENKKNIMEGRLEGIIFTLNSPKYGSDIVIKWKGPKDSQPSAVKDIIEANTIIESENINGDLKILFGYLKEVAEANLQEINESNVKADELKGTKNKSSKQFSVNFDKKQIVDAIYNSMKKFDDIETYKENEKTLNKYIILLTDEVKKHYVQDIDTDIEDESQVIEPIINFINFTVKAIVMKKAANTPKKELPIHIPNRWGNYSNIGNPIPGTRFIAFKVPLSKHKEWNLGELKKSVPELKSIIDLTNTCKYYQAEECEELGLQYRKIFIPGHAVPDDKYVQEFFDVVSDTVGGGLIGVHCTHGLNRTGYMICRYMIDVLGVVPEDAIAAFDDARGHKQERKNYLDSLRNQIQEDKK